MRIVHRCVNASVIQKLAMGVAAVSLVGGLAIVGPTSNAGASGSFSLTVSQAMAAKLCFSRSTVDPESGAVCLPGHSGAAYEDALPATARKSNLRNELCSTALGVTSVGDAIFIEDLFVTPSVYLRTIGAEASTFAVCYDGDFEPPE